MCGFEALPYPIIITFVSDSTYMCIFVFGFIVVAGCLVAWIIIGHWLFLENHCFNISVMQSVL